MITSCCQKNRPLDSGIWTAIAVMLPFVGIAIRLVTNLFFSSVCDCSKERKGGRLLFF
ncbi:MAG: hypothetical protein AB1500_01115 [Bacillota bacterium]